MSRFLQKTTICCATLLLSFVMSAQDIIITKDAKKIDAKIVEISKAELKYKDFDNPEGPTFILETTELHTVILENGKVLTYNQPAQNEQNNSAQIISQSSPVNQQAVVKEEISLAHAENFNGVYVFTDSSPVSPYDILGNVNLNRREDKISMVMTTTPNHTMQMTPVLTFEETPQYTEIRNGLISQAIMTNRQVEGILISITKAGEGSATLIKFKDATADKSLAKVNAHMGILVFTDCKPVNTYSFVGKINRAGGLDSDYNVLRDRLIKKTIDNYPSAQGIIPHFVTGGRDSAEAIKF